MAGTVSGHGRDGVRFDEPAQLDHGVDRDAPDLVERWPLALAGPVRQRRLAESQKLRGVVSTQVFAHGLDVCEPPRSCSVDDTSFAGLVDAFAGALPEA